MDGICCHAIHCCLLIDDLSKKAYCVSVFYLCNLEKVKQRLLLLSSPCSVHGMNHIFIVLCRK